MLLILNFVSLLTTICFHCSKYTHTPQAMSVRFFEGCESQTAKLFSIPEPQGFGLRWQLSLLS